jgi:hypothetical protein
MPRPVLDPARRHHPGAALLDQFAAGGEAGFGIVQASLQLETGGARESRPRSGKGAL